MRHGDLVDLAFKRQQFNILMGEPEGLVVVDGIVAAELGLHIGVTYQVDVTHVPSGKRIGGFDTLGAALEFVERVAYIRDWSTVPLTVTQEEEKAVWDAYKAVLTTMERPRRIAL
jgi:hypothetical protein